MKDADFLYEVLSDDEWHSWDEIMRRSQRERGCGMTIHSRAADLRRRGLVVECETRKARNGRRVSWYRLGSLDAASVSDLGSTLPESVCGLGEGCRAGDGMDAGAASSENGQLVMEVAA